MTHRVLRTGFPFAALPILIIAAVLIAGCGKQKSDAAAELAKSPDYVAAMGHYDKNQVDSAIVYFEKLTKKLPDNADGWAWYAEAARRMNNMDESKAAGWKALSIDPKHAFAHTVLGNLYNPQFSAWKEANADTSWLHLTKAVESDPDECNAWVTIWIEAMRRGDKKLEQKAVAQLHANKFFSETVYEQDRWLMKHLPQNAVFITNGDIDTYPSVILQQMESFRPDVAVVNINLLNMPWYAKEMKKRFNLALPMNDAEVDAFQPYYDDQSRPILLPAVLLKFWFEQSGKSGRPLAFSATCDLNQVAPVISSFVHKGGYYEPLPGNAIARIDTAAAMLALEGIDGKLFAGRMATDIDRSSVRRSVAPGTAASLPFGIGTLLIRELIATKHTESAKAFLEKMRAFAADAKMDKSYLSELEALEKQLK